MKFEERFKEILLKSGYQRSFLVTSSFRSGSSVICELLEKNGLPASAHERLAVDWSKTYESSSDLEEYFQSIVAGNLRPVFATKIMWPQRNNFARIIGLDPLDVNGFVDLFPSPRWIHIYRSDIFSQAVSFWKAKNSDKWHVFDAADLVEDRLEYSFEGLLSSLREISLHDKLWRQFYARCNIEPIYISYEEFLEDPDGVLRDILVEMNLELPEKLNLAPRQRQQSNAHSNDIKERFLSDLFQMGH